MLAIIVLFAIVTVSLFVTGMAPTTSKEAKAARRVVAMVLLVATMMDNVTTIHSAMTMYSDNACVIGKVSTTIASRTCKDTGGKEKCMNLFKKVKDAFASISAEFTAAIGCAVVSAESALHTMDATRYDEPAFAIVEEYVDPVLGQKPATKATFVMETENGEERYEFGDTDTDSTVGPVAVFQEVLGLEENAKEDKEARKVQLNKIKEELARHYMDSVHGTDRAVKMYRLAHSISDDTELTCDEVIDAVFVWSNVQSVCNGTIRWNGKGTKALIKNYRGVASMLLATEVFKRDINMDDDAVEDDDTIVYGDYVFHYDVNKARAVYGKDIAADLRDNSLCKNFDKYTALLARTRAYITSFGDVCVSKLETASCMTAHLNGCVSDMDFIYNDEGELERIESKYLESPWEETRKLQLPVFQTNVAQKKTISTNLSVRKIYRKVIRMLAKEGVKNPTRDQVETKLMEVNPETNMTILETYNSKYSVYQGVVAKSPLLYRHMARHPESMVFALNMRDISQELITYILDNGILVVTADEDNPDKLTKVRHLYYIGQSMGGEKNSTFLFIETPDDYESSPAMYLAELTLDCAGLTKAKDELREIEKDAKKKGESEDFENDLYSITIDLIAKHAKGLCEEVEKDEYGQPLYKCSRSKFIARMALMHSTVMRQGTKASFKELLEIIGKDIYVVDGSSKQEVELADGEEEQRSVNGIMSTRKIDKFEARLGDGGSLGSDEFCAALAVLCPDVPFTKENLVEYCKIIKKLTNSTGRHEWALWTEILKTSAEEYKNKFKLTQAEAEEYDKDPVKYKEEIDKTYRRYLELDALIPGAFQVRNTGGFKSVIQKANIGAISDKVVGIEAEGKLKEVLDAINKPLISKPLNTAGLITDTNAVKYFSDNWADQFYICEHSEIEGHGANMSAQGWLTLDITNPVEALNIVAETVLAPMGKAIESPENMIDYLNAQKVVIDAESIAKGVNELVIMKKMLQTCPSTFDTSEFSQCLYRYMHKALDNAQQGRLRVRTARTMFVVVDQYAHMNVLLEREMDSAKVKKLKTMEELTGNTFKNSCHKGATMAFIYGANNGRKAQKASAIRFPLLSAPEWFKLDVLSYSKFYNGCKGVCVICGRTNIVAGMQGGDTDGDHLVIFFADDALGQLIYEHAVTQFGISRIYVDSVKPEDGYYATVESKDWDDATGEVIIKAYSANNVGDDVGKIADSAMFASDVYRHIKGLAAVADAFGADYIRFLAPGEEWGIKEIDDAQKDGRFLNGKRNPMNDNDVDAVDETSYDFSAQRSIDGIYIPNELKEFGDKAKEWARISEDGETRLFTGWVLARDDEGLVVVAEMPYVSKIVTITEEDEVIKEWTIQSFVPEYDKREGVDPDYMPKKAQEVTKIKGNGLLKRAFRFGYELVPTDVDGMWKLGKGHKIRVHGDKNIFEMKAKDIKSLIEINEEAGSKRHDIAADEIAYVIFLLNLCNAQEAGREIDKKKHIIGAIWSLMFGCTPTWKLHVSATKGKELSESQARSQYVSASVLGAINAMVLHERKAIEDVLEYRCKTCFSITPYLLSLISEQDDIYALDEVQQDIRNIKSQYIREVSQYAKETKRGNIAEREEKIYAAIEGAKARLYSLTNKSYDGMNVGIDTIAIMTYFVGCESKPVRASKQKGVNGRTVHNAPTSFSMILGNELVGVLENAEDALTITRVPKNAEEDKLRVHDGWLWIVNENGDENLYKRVTNDMSINYNKVTIKEVNGTKYARLYRNSVSNKKFCSPVFVLGEEGAYNIVCKNPNIGKALMNYAATVGEVKVDDDIFENVVKMTFKFDQKTKAIAAILIQENGSKTKIGYVDMFDDTLRAIDNLEGIKLSVQACVDKYGQCDMDLQKALVLLGLVNTECYVSLENAKLTDKGNITGLENVVCIDLTQN